MMHRLLVEDLKWVSEKRFIHALNFCMLLPGPEAQQLTIYLGWLLHRIRGGVLAGVIFILPGALSVLFLSIIYVKYQNSIVIDSLFFGVKAAVLAIVLTSVVSIARRAIRTGSMVTITVVAFIAIFIFAIPFPVVIFGAGLMAIFMNWTFASGLKGGSNENENEAKAVDIIAMSKPPARHISWLVATFFGVLWLLPVAMLYGFFGVGNIYTQQALFFSQVAIVTFGGAYAVLSYIAQQTVEHYGWLSGAEMLDGLGMAEATPGPLIMVTQFVGFICAYRNPGFIDPMLAGCLGALVTTWVTFAPCFFWIFLGAPYIEGLNGNRILGMALQGITAAVVGVVLNLTLWFGSKVLFTDFVELSWKSLNSTFLLPSLASIDLIACAIFGMALFAILKLRVGVIKVLATSAGAGLVLGLAGPV